jgi:hypothetical protein
MTRFFPPAAQSREPWTTLLAARPNSIRRPSPALPERAATIALSEPQVDAIRTLHAPYKFPFALANSVTDYPGWGVSGENNPSHGPTGGWSAWWLGSTPPVVPPAPTNGIAWIFGAGGLQYIFARDPNLDPRAYKPEDHADRVRQVSALMDSTNPDLSAFRAHGGKLIMLEHMSDYAQSPSAEIGYFQSVEARMGADATREFMRLYAAPGADHVGAGAPANIDMLNVLVDWVEHGKALDGYRTELPADDWDGPLAAAL